MPLSNTCYSTMFSLHFDCPLLEKVKVKIKLSLSTPWRYVGTWGTAPQILNLGAKRSEWSVLSLRRFTTRESVPVNHGTEGWISPKTGLVILKNGQLAVLVSELKNETRSLVTVPNEVHRPILTYKSPVLFVHRGKGHLDHTVLLLVTKALHF